jgi:hypothetical protein
MCNAPVTGSNTFTHKVAVLCEICQSLRGGFRTKFHGFPTRILKRPRKLTRLPKRSPGFKLAEQIRRRSRKFPRPFQYPCQFPRSFQYSSERPKKISTGSH